MIISYSNNFVVVRVPRAAGTSLAFYFFKSGLIDPQKDLYKIEGAFPSWQDFDTYIANEGLDFKTLPIELYTMENLAEVRRPFFDLAAKGAVPHDMPCVATIREPFSRFASAFKYSCADYLRRLPESPNALYTAKRILGEGFPDGEADVNVFWDFILENYLNKNTLRAGHGQTYYFPEHAEVFNVENLHQHVSKFISERGGIVADPIELRRNPDVFTSDQTDAVLSKFTPDRRQQLIDMFPKDFEVWEKAYAVYN